MSFYPFFIVKVQFFICSHNVGGLGEGGTFMVTDPLASGCLRECVCVCVVLCLFVCCLDHGRVLSCFVLFCFFSFVEENARGSA